MCGLMSTESQVLRRREFRTADVFRAVNDLALQVAEIDDVEIHDADPADSGHAARYIAANPGPPAPMPSFAVPELTLTVDADLRHDQMPAVALDFVVVQLRKRFVTHVHW